MAAFAVYHIEKGSTSSGGIGNHIDRVPGKEFSYQHADPSRADKNFFNTDLNKYTAMPLKEAIEERIKDGYTGKKALRSDAVKFTTHILTGSHEEMTEIFKSQEKAKAWLKSNLNFLAREYGLKNIVRFVLHQDERTPHIHAVVVPLTKDGRLSAKEIIGNRKDLQGKQDRYAAAMQSFDLGRGLKSTGIKHSSAREYYGQMEKTMEVKKRIDEISVRNIPLPIISIPDKKTFEGSDNYKKRVMQAVSAPLQAFIEEKEELHQDLKNAALKPFYEANSIQREQTNKMNQIKEKMRFTEEYARKASIEQKKYKVILEAVKEARENQDQNKLVQKVLEVVHKDEIKQQKKSQGRRR